MLNRLKKSVQAEKVNNWPLSKQIDYIENSLWDQCCKFLVHSTLKLVLNFGTESTKDQLRTTLFHALQNGYFLCLRYLCVGQFQP